VRRRSRFSRQELLYVCLLALASVGASAQQPESKASPQPEAKPGENIAGAWDGLLQNALPQTKVDPTLEVPQNPFEKEAAGAFLSHFFFESRTEYWRTQTYFTGRPTATSVINAAPGPVANPNGIPDPSVFQPSTNELYSFLNWGTRGWLSDRVNTNFSFRYWQDLTRVTDGSPALSIINTFGSNRRLELVSGYFDIIGRPADGAFAGATLRLGRQDVYGADLAALDGISFTTNRPKYSYTLYAGRRFTYFSDPDQRVVGGGSFAFHFGDNASLEYDALFYIKGTHIFTYRQRFGRAWLFSTYYKMIGSFPIDYSANAIWTPFDGKTMVRLGFFQKLTNKDYFYDYTINARDLDVHNPLLRLNLGPFSPYSQVVLDAQRTISSRLRLGGSVWVRRLNDSTDQGPFDTSFEDYRANAQVFPGRKFDISFEYHERNSDRSSTFSATLFDDVSTTGETKIRDLSAEVGRSFADGRLNFKAGGFYRLLNFQDRFFVLHDAHDKGVLGSAVVKLDQRTRAYVDYSLDTDFFIFRPSIQNTQVFRIGMAWRY
jgi:hypothetical protein